MKDPGVHARRWAELAKDRPLARSNLARQLVAASRFSAPEQLVPPVLVLVGEGDELCKPSCPKALAARFGASLAVHPQAGHDLALDDREWMVSKIREWAS